jgi:hypothetical protein
MGLYVLVTFQAGLRVAALAQAARARRGSVVNCIVDVVVGCLFGVGWIGSELDK